LRAQSAIEEAYHQNPAEESLISIRESIVRVPRLYFALFARAAYLSGAGGPHRMLLHSQLLLPFLGIAAIEYFSLKETDKGKAAARQ